MIDVHLAEYNELREEHPKMEPIVAALLIVASRLESIDETLKEGFVDDGDGDGDYPVLLNDN